MTDPSEQVAAQIGQHAEQVRDATPGQDIAQAAAANTGLGVTSVDVGELAATIQAMQARLSELESEKAAATGQPLADTVKTLQHFLAGHGDPLAVELGNDLAAAVDAAQQSGDVSRVQQIAARLDRHLGRNAPYPGENYFYRNAVAFTSDLPDVIDGFKPVQVGPPAKVVAGSVIG